MDEKTNASGAQPHAGCFVCNNVLPMFRNLWSEATEDHFRSSRIEFLKGIRGLIDDRIARLSREESKGQRVVVE